MKCRYVHSQLEIYLDREIPPAERRRLQAHLAQCIDCRRELDELDALQSQIRNSLRLLVGRALPASDAWERIQASIHSSKFPLANNQPARREAAPPDWHPLVFSSSWSAFCLPRGAWW
jgi:anti-sigma factor RsiW